MSIPRFLEFLKVLILPKPRYSLPNAHFIPPIPKSLKIMSNPSSTDNSNIKKGILEKQTAFVEGLEKPEDSSSDLDRQQKQEFLQKAKKMNAFYHFVKEDAVSTSNLEKNALEAIKDTIALTESSFADLDTLYNETLLTCLADNIKAARQVSKKFEDLSRYTTDLAKDIHQEDDSLFTELLESVSTEEATKLKSEIEQDIPLKGGAEGDDPLQLKEPQKQVKDKIVALEDFVREQFITINFPSVKQSFDALKEAATALDADLSKNTEEMVAEEDTAMKEWQETQSLFKPGDADAAVKQITALIPNTPKKKKKAKKGKEITPLEQAEMNKNELQASLNSLKSKLSYNKNEIQKIDDYSKRLEETETLLSNVQTHLSTLTEIFTNVLKGKDPDKISLAKGKEKIDEYAKTIFANLDILGQKEAIINKWHEKFSDKDTQSDVKIYIARISEGLAGIVEPVNMFTEKIQSNSYTLDQLRVKLENLNSTYFVSLANHVGNSALTQANATPEGKIAGILKDFNAQRETLTTSSDALKEGISSINKDLNIAILKYNEEKSKADFADSLSIEE
jgi:hypothetical protein